MIDTFIGRPVSDWLDIDRFLQSNNIKNAAELADRLGMKEAISRTLRVVDSKNHKRILGHLLIRPHLDIRKDNELRVAVSPSLRRGYRETVMPYDLGVNVLRLRIERETFDGGWTYTPYLTTDDPLDQLMLVDDFRLPGETPRQADERRYRGR
jgi:hypothetical protein